MPLDGIVADCIAQELNNRLSGGKIMKIFQPEKDEIYMHIWSRGDNFKLLLSANPNYPRIHLTSVSSRNPTNPPVFCMLLRKHLTGGKILSIQLNNFERIFTIDIESLNELGDISVKKLIIEIMGRHSNIILVNEKGKIIDAIKHIDKEISRVREVMPAREYELPPPQDKISPLDLDIDRLLNIDAFSNDTLTENHGNATLNMSIGKYLLNNIKGFSPFLCRDICFAAGIDDNTGLGTVLGNEMLVSRLKAILSDTINKIKDRDYKPCIVYTNYTDENINAGIAEKKPQDFHCLPVRHYTDVKYFDSISTVLDIFYSEKDESEKLKQKKNSLLKVIDANLDRCRKKLAIQQDALREVADMEKLKLYGELITAYIYSIPPNSNKVSLPNYYSPDNEYVEIELDPNKTPQENAQYYFKKYNKAKSTYYNTSIQIKESQEEIDYLENVAHLLGNCTTQEEVEEIREELENQGYIASKQKKTYKSSAESKKSAVSKPLHYLSSDGFDIYVGKNNRQNDFLTFKFSSPRDLWLHVRNIPGSHTIIKSHKKEIPDSTLLEAAIIAAWHSKAQYSSNVPVDYTAVKNVKKPGNAKPGMVIYENFKTIFVTPDANLVKKLKFEREVEKK